MEYVNDDNFEEKVLKADKPVVVDFYADWCGPCKFFAPVFEEVADETDDKLFFKLNVDESQQTAAKFGVRSIPTMIAFKDGEPVDHIIGGQTKESFVDWLGKV